MKFPLRSSALLLCLALTACSDDNDSKSKAKPPGSVTPLATACPSGDGTVSGTTCQVLRVRSNGNDDIDVELRVTEPNPQAAEVGTVVLSSGGVGDAFYAELGGGSTLVQALSDAGWRVVDRKWQGGWYSTSTSLKQQSLRYAVLLDWISKNVHQGGSLAATGNSDGASEIAYALTTWKQGALMDAAILSSGPIMSRVDYLCADVPPQEWLDQCGSLTSLGTFTCGTPECSRSNAPVCLFVDPSATAEQLAEESVLHPGARLDFGATEVHVSLGSDDCTAAPAQALLFHGEVQSSSRVEYVPGAPHELASSQTGRDAIVAALMAVALPAPAEPPAGVRERITILGGDGTTLSIER